MLRLQEKERLEKEKLQQIIDDADDYKDKHRAKRDSNRDAQMKANRDKELVYRSSLMLIACHVLPLMFCAWRWQTLGQGFGNVEVLCLFACPFPSLWCPEFKVIRCTC
jgi:hypothetical protein